MRISKQGIATMLIVVFMVAAGCTVPLSKVATLNASTTNAATTLREFDIFVKGLQYSPSPGKVVGTFGFALGPDGVPSIPGPEIRVKEGDHVRVTLHDAKSHTLHWHGYSVPWSMDGVPYMTQSLGSETYTYEFDANETGTYWYHCHVDVPVHVDEGLFGAFIVEPRDPAADPAFSREYTLFLHELDSSFLDHDPLLAPVVGRDPAAYAGNVPQNPVDAAGYALGSARQGADVAGAIVGKRTGHYALGAAGPRDYYPTGSLRYVPHYDTFMINGKSFPDTKPMFITSGETIRLRLINAGQLVHTMHIHGQHMLVTHKDGYKLASPYMADTLGLFPGERYDLYITGKNPGLWDFHDHGGAWGVGAYASDEGVYPGGMGTMLVYEDFQYAKLPGMATAHKSGDYVVWAPSYQGSSWPDDATRVLP